MFYEIWWRCRRVALRVLTPTGLDFIGNLVVKSATAAANLTVLQSGKKPYRRARPGQEIMSPIRMPRLSVCATPELEKPASDLLLLLADEAGVQKIFQYLHCTIY